MIANIGWGTYLFFAVMNACFLPFIWFFYPETANRSLEEIDILFAKGHVENMSYVRAGAEMPFLTDAEVETEALRYGLIDVVERRAHGRGDVEAQKAGGEVRQRKGGAAEGEDDKERSGSDAEEAAVEESVAGEKRE